MILLVFICQKTDGRMPVPVQRKGDRTVAEGRYHSQPAGFLGPDEDRPGDRGYADGAPRTGKDGDRPRTGG